MRKRNLTIRIQKDREKDFDSIVFQLKKKGLTDVSPAKRFLIVSGVADENAITQIEQVEGIASVRPEQVFSAI